MTRIIWRQRMTTDDPADKIGTESESSNGWLYGYFAFAGAMLAALGVLFGAYVV